MQSSRAPALPLQASRALLRATCNRKQLLSLFEVQTWEAKKDTCVHWDEGTKSQSHARKQHEVTSALLPNGNMYMPLTNLLLPPSLQFLGSLVCLCPNNSAFPGLFLTTFFAAKIPFRTQQAKDSKHLWPVLHLLGLAGGTQTVPLGIWNKLNKNLPRHRTAHRWQEKGKISDSYPTLDSKYSHWLPTPRAEALHFSCRFGEEVLRPVWRKPVSSWTGEVLLSPWFFATYKLRDETKQDYPPIHSLLHRLHPPIHSLLCMHALVDTQACTKEDGRRPHSCWVHPWGGSKRWSISLLQKCFLGLNASFWSKKL